MPRRLIIMTVGTSLIENKGGDRPDGARNVEGINKAVTGLRLNPCDPGLRREVLTALRDLDPKREFGLRPGTDEERDRLPAELSYLYKLLSHMTSEDVQTHVVLLPSDTPEGEACADIIKQYLQAPPDGWPTTPVTVEVEPTEGLGGLQVEDRERFRDEGIPHLVCAIRNHAHQKQGDRWQWDEVILNFTGGFKAAIPYETFAAVLLERDDIRIHYLFEATQEILELPQYPMGLDFPRWHRQNMLLQAATAHPDIYARHLDPRMRTIHTAPSAEGSLEWVLRERYRDQVETDPLQEYSEAVIRQLVSDASLRGRLNKILPAVGPLLWMGDKISMAADHAARHHHNLLEFAQVLLTPLPPEFLSQEERFVLLAALMLHDCGHTLDALPLDGDEDRPIPLFPLEIRKYHHFLAFRRLTTPHLAQDVGWDPAADLAEAVAWRCFYHRKNTGWDQCGSASECPFWQPEPAGCHVLEAGERFEADGVDLPKLVALLRIIDGCDNQSRRVGPSPQAEMMRRLFDTDERTHRLSDGGAPPQVPGDTRERMVRSAAPGSALWTALAREVDECRLRSNQFVHFLKHQGVRTVTLLPAQDFRPDSQWHFTIELEPDDGDEFRHESGGKLLIDDEGIARDNADEIDKKPTVRDWIWKEVAGEFEAKALAYLQDRAGRSVGLRMRWAGREWVQLPDPAL